MYLLLHALCLSVVITCFVIVMLAAYVVFVVIVLIGTTIFAVITHCYFYNYYS